jgi:FtsZ-interacting cell division protein ZipA
VTRGLLFTSFPLKSVSLAVETYSEYESVASESKEPSLEEVKKAGRKAKVTKKGKAKEGTPKIPTEEESAAEKAKPPSGSAPKQEVPKQEERKPTLARASKPPSKIIKNVPAGKNGQKTLNLFFGKR